MNLINAANNVKAAICLSAAMMILNLTGCAALPGNQSIREGVGNLAVQKISGNKSSETVKPSEKNDSTLSEPSLSKKEDRGPAIIEAVQNCDAGALGQLLSDVDDVRPLVPEGTLLLHMAEESMGIGGLVNPVTELLVAKKAWTMQRDSLGRKANYVVYEWELGGTPRWEYLEEIIGGKFSAYYKAINSDSVEDIKSFSEQLPMDKYVMFDALQRQKAVAIAAYALEQGAPAQAVLEASGENLLHLLCSNIPYQGTPFPAREELAEKLIAGRADIHELSGQGYTPLLYLVKSASKDSGGYLGDPSGLVRLLLMAGSDPNVPGSPSDNMMSMLNIAVSNRMDGVAELLLEFGALVDDGAANAPNASDRARALMAMYK